MLALIVLVACLLRGGETLPTAQQLLHLQPGEIQYIIVISKLSQHKNSIFEQLPSETRQHLLNKYSKIPDSEGWTSQDFDMHIIDSTFKRFYNWNKTLTLVIDEKNVTSKQTILKQISQRFNDDKYSATLLYYSGPSDPLYGGWIVSSEEKWSKLITYKQISKLWKGRNSKKPLQQLHIVLQSDYSQHWVQKCYNLVEFDDISVQASALKNETTQSIKYGGLFTNNLVQAVLNHRNQTFIKQSLDSQHIIGIGFEIFLEKIFGVPLYFQSWKQLFESRLLPLLG